MGGSCLHFRGELPKRRYVVENPECPAVRGRHQIIVLDHQIVHGRRGHVETQGLPRATLVAGEENAKFGAGKEQTSPDWIFTDDADISAFRNAGIDAGPTLAEIVGAIDVRAEVIEAMAIDRGVSCTGVKVRSINDADLAPVRKTLWRDVAPVLAAVAGELDQSAVRARPDLPGADGRWRNGINHAMAACLGVLHGQRPLLRRI